MNIIPNMNTMARFTIYSQLGFAAVQLFLVSQTGSAWNVCFFVLSCCLASFFAGAARESIWTERFRKHAWNSLGLAREVIEASDARERERKDSADWWKAE